MPIMQGILFGLENGGFPPPLSTPPQTLEKRAEGVENKIGVIHLIIFVREARGLGGGWGVKEGRGWSKTLLFLPGQIRCTYSCD